MLSRPYNNFIRRSIQPGPPKAECTVRTYIMPAAAHKLHIIETVFTFIPVNYSILISMIILAQIRSIIRKQIKMCIRHTAFYIFFSRFIVTIRTNSSEHSFIFRIKIIPPPDMYTDRIFCFHLFFYIYILTICRFRKLYFLLEQGHYIMVILLTGPMPF